MGYRDVHNICRPRIKIHLYDSIRGLLSNAESPESGSVLGYQMNPHIDPGSVELVKIQAIGETRGSYTDRKPRLRDLGKSI